MKNLVLGLALVGLAFACKSQDTATVSGADAATVPSPECSATKSCCPGEAAAECSEAKKAECASKKACTAVQN